MNSDISAPSRVQFGWPTASELLGQQTGWKCLFSLLYKTWLINNKNTARILPPRPFEVMAKVAPETQEPEFLQAVKSCRDHLGCLRTSALKSQYSRAYVEPERHHISRPRWRRGEVHEPRIPRSVQALSAYKGRPAFPPTASTFHFKFLGRASSKTASYLLWAAVKAV